MWLDLLQLLITALASLAALFLLTKLMGNKQVSQLNIFDYIVGISIGSIAAEMATELESPLRPLCAMVVFALCAYAISVWTNTSLPARRIITGKPLILLDDGNLYRENLKRARMDLSEFLMYCRIQGYFNPDQIQTAVLEHNGSISILPRATDRPVTPADLSRQPQQELLPIPVIMDGYILQNNLQKAGKDNVWLERQLRAQGQHAAKEILLALCDGNLLQLYPMQPRKDSSDLTDA